jgi:hypothetical protein
MNLLGDAELTVCTGPPELENDRPIVPDAVGEIPTPAAKSWVFSFRVNPPTDRVFSARNGSDVFFAAHSRVLQRFYMVIPGRGEEEIDEPQMIYLEDDYAKAHAKDIGTYVRRPTLRLRESKAVQFELAL